MAEEYRKKAVPVDAIQLTRENVDEVAAWCGGEVFSAAKPGDPSDIYVALDIPTLGGKLRAETFHASTYRDGAYHGGDYVVRDAEGKYFPVAPDVFDATYDAL